MSLSSIHGALWPSATAPRIPAWNGVDQTPSSQTRPQETNDSKNNRLTLPDSQLCKPSLPPPPTIPPLHSPPFLLPVEITIASRNDRHTANLKFNKYRARCQFPAATNNLHRTNPHGHRPPGPSSPSTAVRTDQSRGRHDSESRGGIER